MSTARADVVKMTIGASQETKDVHKSIKSLRKEIEKIFDFSNLYETFLHFNLQEAKEKLKIIIEGPKMEEIKKFKDQHEIVYIDGELDKNNLLQDKIYIKIINDAEQFPIYVYVAFKNLFSSSDFNIDLKSITEKSELVKNSSLIYIKYLNNIQEEYQQIVNQIQKNTEVTKINEQIILFNQNKNWKDDVLMTADINIDKAFAKLKVKDKYGIISIKSTLTYRPRSIDFSMSRLYTSIWQQVDKSIKEAANDVVKNIQMNKS